MDWQVLGNRIEAALWFVLAGGCGIAAAVRPRARGLLLLLALDLVAFGFSDLVEARTGAWWRPGWLFAWKTACVAGFAALLAVHLRARKKG